MRGKFVRLGEMQVFTLHTLRFREWSTHSCYKFARKKYWSIEILWHRTILFVMALHVNSSSWVFQDRLYAFDAHHLRTTKYIRVGFTKMQSQMGLLNKFPHASSPLVQISSKPRKCRSYTMFPRSLRESSSVGEQAVLYELSVDDNLAFTIRRIWGETESIKRETDKKLRGIAKEVRIEHTKYYDDDSG